MLVYKQHTVVFHLPYAEWTLRFRTAEISNFGLPENHTEIYLFGPPEMIPETNN